MDKTRIAARLVVMMMVISTPAFAQGRSATAQVSTQAGTPFQVLQAQVAALETRVDTIDQAMQALQTQITTINATLFSLQSQITEGAETTASLAVRIAANEAAIAALTSAVDALRVQLAAAEAAIAAPRPPHTPGCQRTTGAGLRGSRSSRFAVRKAKTAAIVAFLRMSSGCRRSKVSMLE